MCADVCEAANLSTKVEIPRKVDVPAETLDLKEELELEQKPCLAQPVTTLVLEDEKEKQVEVVSVESQSKIINEHLIVEESPAVEELVETVVAETIVAETIVAETIVAETIVAETVVENVVLPAMVEEKPKEADTILIEVDISEGTYFKGKMFCIFLYYNTNKIRFNIF